MSWLRSNSLERKCSGHDGEYFIFRSWPRFFPLRDFCVLPNRMVKAALPKKGERRHQRCGCNMDNGRGQQVLQKLLLSSGLSVHGGRAGIPGGFTGGVFPKGCGQGRQRYGAFCGCGKSTALLLPRRKGRPCVQRIFLVCDGDCMGACPLPRLDRCDSDRSCLARIVLPVL